MNIAIYMMCRNEDDLLFPWALYHGSQFGFDNVTVLDNGSSSQKARETLVRLTNMGVRVDGRFGSPHDFIHKGDIIKELVDHRAASNPADFYFPLDCDEFLGAETLAGIKFDRASIQAELSRYMGADKALAVRAVFNNNLNMPGFFRRNDKCRKVFFSAKGCSFLDHGYHVGRGINEDGVVTTSIVYGHFHHKPYLTYRAHSLQKLGPVMDDLSEESLLDHRDNARMGYHVIDKMLGGVESYQRIFERDFDFELPDLRRAFFEMGQPFPFTGCEG